MFSSQGPSVHRGGNCKRCVGRLPVSRSGAAARTRAQQRAWAPSPRAMRGPWCPAACPRCPRAHGTSTVSSDSHAEAARNCRARPFALLPPSETATGTACGATPPPRPAHLYGFTLTHCSFPLQKLVVSQCRPGIPGRGQKKGGISTKVSIPEEEMSILYSASLLTMKRAVSQILWSTLSYLWDFLSPFFFSLSLFFFSFSVDDKILFQKLVFMDVSRRLKQNIYFLFLLVNQNVLFKESALCRIAHELLPLMEIKEKYQEVFLVIPSPCLFLLFS